ncbi:MAG TPA: DUF4124 domain-containing protein [Gammaproteobacteria bacterium]|nr:DUF4124 domain-containing protein [Gammaproteobacteria bacterium]
MRLFFVTVLLAIAMPTTAQIYQYTDDKGNRVFTDQPPHGIDASKVELPTINSVPMQTTADTAEGKDPDATEPAAPYTLLQLSGLPDEEALRANNGSFTLQVEINPELASQHRLQLLIDGQAYGVASRSTSLSVENLDRGEHRLAVQVLADGTTLQTSAEESITVQRVHTNSPALGAKPRPLFSK